MPEAYGPVVERHASKAISDGGTDLEERWKREVVGTKSRVEKTAGKREEAPELVGEGRLGVGGEEDVPGVHVPLRHPVEHLAGEVDAGAAGVHEDEVGLERDVGEEATDDDLRVGFQPIAQARRGSTLSQARREEGRQAVGKATAWHLNAMRHMHATTENKLK